MRKALAVTLTLALQVAGLGAPLVHAHPDDHATAHHAGRAVHTHWGGHSPHSRHRHETPGFTRADDDRAVFLDVFVAVAVAQLAVPALAPAAFQLHVPAVRAALGGVAVVHGHDPPLRRSRPSRAPPTLLF